MFITYLKEFPELDIQDLAAQIKEDPSFYKSLFEVPEYEPLYKTPFKIALEERKRFDLHKTQLWNPKSKISFKKDKQTIEIQQYNRILFGHPCRLEIHLHKNHLFYYKQVFSREIPLSRKAELMSFFKTMYAVEDNFCLDAGYIVDPYQTILKFNDFDCLEMDVFNLKLNAINLLSQNPSPKSLKMKTPLPSVLSYLKKKVLRETKPAS